MINGGGGVVSSVGSGSGADENTLEPILVSEVYPKKQIQCDEEGLRIPFQELHGESVEHLGRTGSDGIIALSNYRLFVLHKDSFINIPVGIVESVEYRDIFYMHVFCKDARTLRCAFSTNDACLEWCKRLMRAVRPPSRLQQVFAFSFHAWLSDARRQQLTNALSHLTTKSDDTPSSTFDREVTRLGFLDGKNAWRITYVNSKYRICGSYPECHIVPHSVADKDIESSSGFRSSRRFPSVVWRDVRTGVVLARSSQPEVGWLGWRNTQDESLLQAIAESCALHRGGSTVTAELNHIDSVSAVVPNGYGVPNGVSGGSSVVVNGTGANGPDAASRQSNSLLIVDARSYAAAVANRAKGGGCECQDYYPNCEILFMSLANIHTIRKSFLALRTICAMSPDQPGWLINLENTKWLQYISGLLKASLLVVNAIDKDRKSVLVHCSDGWDRTPQIVALAELLLDPYYRTVEGFRVLVEKEWLEFGHKFADRCGQGTAADDVNERCPVFLQWLDCVHQLLRQFPCSFQFNETFLVKLVQHVYSCLFGEFLCNTERDRSAQRVRQLTTSVWTLLSPQNIRFVNVLYQPSMLQRVLRPSCHIQNLHFWDAVYLSETAPAMASGVSAEQFEAAGSDVSSSSAVTSPDQQVSCLPVKTRSCDDLTKAGLDDDDVIAPMMSAQRRLSDPNIAAHSAAADAAASAPTEATDEDEDDIGNVRTAVSCQQTDDVAHCDGHRQNDADNADTTSVAAPTAVSLVAVSSQKCASNETLKAVEDETTCDSSCSGQLLSNDCLDNASKQTGFSDASSPAVLSMFQASSDTLTGEDGHSLAVLAGESNTVQPPALVSVESENPAVNGVELLVDGVAVHSQVLKMKTMLDRCSSTSDISSSHVVCDSTILTNGGTRKAVTPLTVDTRLALAASAGNSTTPKGVVNGDGDGPGISQPPSCGSTSPPTPNSDIRLLGTVRPVSKLSDCVDWDGLTYHVDPVQQRVAQMLCEHDQLVHQLDRQLTAARTALSKYSALYGQNVVDGRDDLASNDSSEPASAGVASAAASDLSWEQVEEKDSRVTLWVPDHVVTHCAGCHQEFWMVRRKHHCRSCGHVFCGECSDYSLPVPQQHLDKPVRVCFHCFRQASLSSDTLAAISNPSDAVNGGSKAACGLSFAI